MNLISLLPINQAPQAHQDQHSQTIDTNADGNVSQDELMSYFDSQGTGSFDPIDFAAHVRYHQENPHVLQPYMDQAAQRLQSNPEMCNSLMEKYLDETLYISNRDTNANDKTRQALTKGEDVKVMDPTKINQLKVRERFQELAGITK